MNGKKDFELSPAIIEQIKKGNKIEAIKMLRVENNLDLKTAKGLVDRFSVDGNISINNPENQKNITVSENVLSFLRKGKKNDAIKVLRQETGLGMKDSKEMVEKVLSENSEVNELYSAYTKEGVRKFLFVVSILILIYLIFYILK
jgi:ribosomal protein L7/L12